MAEYNPSKIIKDGNTYNFRDDTKIPLAGSNAISGSLIPSTDGTVNLGSPSYQWNNAYIKSLTINGVACGDILTHNVSEFVNVTSDQTIGGNKTFSSLVSKSGTLERGSLPTDMIKDDPIFISVDKNNRKTLAVYNSYYVNGNGRMALYAYNQNTTDYDSIGVIFDFNNASNNKSVYPSTTETYDLGVTYRKWKSFNGINPGALSLPSMTYISLDTTNFDATATIIGTFTPTVDGWAILSMSQKNKHFGIWILYGSYRVTFHSVYHDSAYMIFALIPVRANVTMTVYCTANDIDSTRKVDWLRLFPCQGNV